MAPMNPMCMTMNHRRIVPGSRTSFNHHSIPDSQARVRYNPIEIFHQDFVRRRRKIADTTSAS